MFIVLTVCSCGNLNDGGGTDGGGASTVPLEWDGLGELATSAEFPDIRVLADSTVGGSTANLLNYTENNGVAWFSGVGGDESGSHYIALDFGKTRNVHKVALTPYLNTRVENDVEVQDDFIQCFPKNIAVEYSIEFGKETRVLDLKDYKPQITVNQGITKYSSDVEFGLGGYVTARYVKIVFTGMTDDGLNNYLVKLCNVKAWTTDASELEEAQRVYEESLMPEPYNSVTIGASSVNDADPTAPFKISSLSDGNYGTLWCAEWLNEQSPETDEYVELTSQNGEVVKFTQVVLVGCPGNQSMPNGFEFQYSIDDAGFVTVKTFKDYVNPEGASNTYHIFNLDKPIIADTLRIQFTRKTANPDGYYAVVLGEVEYKAYKATDEEIAKAQADYQAALGRADKTEYADDKGFLIILICISAFVLAVGVAAFFVPVERKFKKEGKA